MICKTHHNVLKSLLKSIKTAFHLIRPKFEKIPSSLIIYNDYFIAGLLVLILLL